MTTLRSLADVGDATAKVALAATLLAGTEVAGNVRSAISQLRRLDEKG